MIDHQVYLCITYTKNKKDRRPQQAQENWKNNIKLVLGLKWFDRIVWRIQGLRPLFRVPFDNNMKNNKNNN